MKHRRPPQPAGAFPVLDSNAGVVFECLCQLAKRHNISRILSACRSMKASLTRTLARVSRTPTQAAVADAPPATVLPPASPTRVRADIPMVKAGEGLLHRFARRTVWTQEHPMLLLPHEHATAEHLRQDGWILLPWRPLLGWDFSDGHDAVRALKEDWKALWMGQVHGEDTDAHDPKALACAQALGLEWAPNQETRCALAYTADGTAVGFAAYATKDGVWTASTWHTKPDSDAGRVLLAATLRAAREARSTVLDPSPEPAHAISRGAEWFWEYLPVQGGGWKGAIAQRLLGLQRSWLDKRNARLLDTHSH